MTELLIPVLWNVGYVMALALCVCLTLYILSVILGDWVPHVR